MTKTLMSRDSVLHSRMLKYKAFSAMFSYPNEKIGENLVYEYDKLFRTSEIWLYGLEYVAGNEYERARMLADISGFYKAFGLETDKERPDTLTCELEFMYYLLLKEINAPSRQKASITNNAQKKFFNEHLYPQAKGIVEKILSQPVENSFYFQAANDLLKFLEEEKEILK